MGGAVARREGTQRHGAPGGDDVQLAPLLQPTGNDQNSQPHHPGNRKTLT